KASGHIFTITDLRPEHSGNYYCEAQNTRGRHKSTLNLTVVSDSCHFLACGQRCTIQKGKKCFLPLTLLRTEAKATSFDSGQNDWRLTCAPTQICAVVGSTVDISCSYRDPDWRTDDDTTAVERLWFTKSTGTEPVDLRADSEHS
ncbi:hypothetical protein INR49_018508, partial [Caranx melampygus]